MKNRVNKIPKLPFKSGFEQEFEITDLDDLYKESFSLLTASHRTAFYQVLWLQERESTHYIDFSPVHTKAGSLLFIHKDMVKQFDRNHPGKGKMILFTDTFFSTQQKAVRFLNSTILFNNFLRVTKINSAHDGIIQLFENIAEEFNRPNDTFKSDILRNLLHNLLLICEREFRNKHIQSIETGIELNTLVAFKKILEEHYQQNKMVSFYASMLHITEKKLGLHTFKILGKTPKEVINERVILESKRLLAHTHMSIKEIGFQLGFDEPTNFVKFFKKHENILPGAFRDQYL